MSLKSNLQQLIKDRNGGLFTIIELEAYCKKAGYKLSNAERRLRPSDSPGIERVFKKGYITGYKYNELVQSENSPSGSANESVRKETRQESMPVQLQMLSRDTWKSSQPFPETPQRKR